MSGVVHFYESRARTLSSGGVVDPPEPEVGIQALRAFDFWDGVGVNTHLMATGPPGGPSNNAYLDAAAVVEFLQRLNIRHIREGTLVRNAISIARANEVGAAGIKLQIITHKPALARPTMWPTSLLDYWYANGLNITYVSGWEGANEQNLPGHNNLPANGYTEAQWATATWDHQTELFTTAHAASRPAAWQAVPVVSWSYGNPNSVARMIEAQAIGDWDSICDVGNLHRYVPENTTSGVFPPLTSIRTYIHDDLTQPLQVTETGHHNLMTYTGSHFPTPEDASAWYQVKAPYVWMKNGIQRVFYYELLDEKPPDVTSDQGYFGWCYYKAPGDAGLFVSKPSGLAMANLLAIYKDPTGAAYIPGKLDYTITASAPNLDVALHQRASDDAFLLALYRDVKLFNRTGSVSPFGTYLSVPDVDVTIDLGRVYATVEHRRPSAVAGAGGGPTLVSTQTDVSVVTVPVGKHLSVLIIKGAWVGPPSSLYGSATYGVSAYGGGAAAVEYDAATYDASVYGS